MTIWSSIKDAFNRKQKQNPRVNLSNNYIYSSQIPSRSRIEEKETERLKYIREENTRRKNESGGSSSTTYIDDTPMNINSLFAQAQQDSVSHFSGHGGSFGGGGASGDWGGGGGYSCDSGGGGGDGGGGGGGCDITMDPGRERPRAMRLQYL